MFLSDPRDTDITFAQPSQGEPFSFSLHDMFRRDPKVEAAIAETGQPDWADVNRMGERFSAGVVAAERQTRLVETVTARENALAEAAASRIDTVRRLTGMQLENPFDGGYIEEAARRVNQRGIYGNDRNAARAEERRNIFNEKIDEVASNFPEHAAALNFGQSLEEQASAIAKGAAYDGEHAGGGILAALAGGLWGSRRDPLFLASLFIGPEASAAKTAIGKIGMGALSSALYNAGLQALAQPAVQQWRADIGERHGVYPALENVGMAFLIGAVPGAAIEGFRALTAPAKTALTKMVDGTASPADVDAAARGLGVTLDDETRRALSVAADDPPAHAAAIGERPPGIPAAEHDAIAAQAVRFAEDPVNNPPPEIPIVAPERPAGQARLIDEAMPGESQQLDSKPVAFARFDPRELTTDAAAFQYKGGGDASGVTDRLRNVTQWDPLASGKTLVFERADGTKIIADGHQRLGLAKRLAGGANRGDVALENGSEFQRIVKDIADNWEQNRMQGRASLFPDEAKLLQAAGFDVGLDGMMTKATLLRLKDEAERVRKGLLKAESGSSDPSVKLDGYLFREADGWTPEDVRAVAAKKNMQEGSGDAIDAARVLRDRPDLLDASLPVSSPMMKNAVALARLSDEAFGMAINGVVPPNYAAAVGSMVSNKLQHAAVLSDLVKFKPESEREARVLIGEVMAAGFRAAEQINLFGAAEATRSLMGERVKILDVAMSALARDKKLFGTLAEKADAIEAAGNQLVRAGNDRRARDAAQLGEMLAKLARVSGPVSDALNRAAAQMADGTLPKARAADAFVDDVRTLLDRDGLVGLLAPRELKPALKVEPATKEALTVAEAAFNERLARDTALPAVLRSGVGAVETTPLTGRALFHETSPDSAASMLVDDLTNSVDRIRSANIFVADNADIAIGQSGQGVRIEFTGDLVSGIEHHKPGTGSLAGREYRTNALGNGAIASVVVAPGERLPLKPAWQSRLDATFTRTDMPDGSVRYDRKTPRNSAAESNQPPNENLATPVAESGITPQRVPETREATFGTIDRDGKPYITIGGRDRLGEIGGDVGAAIGREAAPIRLSASARDHIEARHGAEIRNAGFGGPEDLAARVAANFNEIYRANDGRLFLVERDGHALTAVVELMPDGAASQWDIRTAGLYRADFFNGKEMLWKRPGPDASLPEGKSLFDPEGQSHSNVGASPLADKAEPSLFDSLAVATRDDGRDVRFVPRDQALADAARVEDHADLVASCKS